MYDGMSYYLAKDKDNCTYSVDMIYLRGNTRLNSIDLLLERLRAFHESHPTLDYREELDKPRCSKYDFFQNGVKIDRLMVLFGKYGEFREDTKTFEVLSMVQVRFNPNKLNDAWVFELLKLIDFGDACIRKLDFAVDIPVYIDNVLLPNTRKEPGLYKGTRYYGQSGRHGYVKIYNKVAELLRFDKALDTKTIRALAKDKPLTRVETTLFSKNGLQFDDIAYYDGNVKPSYDDLPDTDRAILDMYFMLKDNGIRYDLRLGRKKMAKLNEYILGGHILIQGSDIQTECLERLNALVDVLSRYVGSISLFDYDSKDDFILLDEDELSEIPFV